MLDLQVLLAFFGASFLLALAPGPDNIFVLTQSALFGSRAGIVTTFGLLSGVLVHTTAVACGVAIIFQTSKLAFILLKFLGAGYLCWLAWQSFTAGIRKVDNARRVFPGYGALFRRGIIMNVTNPKVALFFLAFLPQFYVPGSIPMGFQIFFLGLLFILAAFLVFFPVSLLGGRIALKFNKSAEAQLWLNRMAGIIYLGLALALIFTGK